MIKHFVRDGSFLESIFATKEFEELGVHDQASIILENQHLLELFHPGSLDKLSTILIKSQCTCSFLDFAPDEMSGTDNVFLTRWHTPSCPTIHNPVIEDYSVRQQQRRQKRELLADHKHLLIIEETSTRVKKKETHQHE